MSFKKTNHPVEPPVAAETPALKPTELPKSEDLKLTPEDTKHWEAFQEIIKSKNDNDPRLDTELRNLSPALKNALRKTYATLPSEKRNERGTIVFLIAREFSTPEDLEFLRGVFSEPPCQSFEKCDVTVEQDPHLANINEVSLNYPQIVDLYQLDKKLAANPSLLDDPKLGEGIRALLTDAEHFPVPNVSNRARAILKKYNL